MKLDFLFGLTVYAVLHVLCACISCFCLVYEESIFVVKSLKLPFAFGISMQTCCSLCHSSFLECVLRLFFPGVSSQEDN
jgi:hypothetical protein